MAKRGREEGRKAGRVPHQGLFAGGKDATQAWICVREKTGFKADRISSKPRLLPEQFWTNCDHWCLRASSSRATSLKGEE